jgi:hypothetical protein
LGSQELDNDNVRQYVWNYFQLHASQRLTTFNFYIIIATVVATGYVTLLSEDHLPILGITLGLLLTFLSFIFWKLDTRNKQLIKNAEDALKLLEEEYAKEKDGKPNILRIFTYEEYQTNIIKRRRSFWIWKKYYSYSNCFNLVFLTFGALGILAAIYSIIEK